MSAPTMHVLAVKMYIKADGYVKFPNLIKHHIPNSTLTFNIKF